MRSLSDRDIFVRGRAAVALGNLNTAGDPNLQKMVTAGLALAIGDNESYVRWRVAAALGQIGTEEAVAALVRLLGDETSGVRQNAVKSLGQIGSTAALLALEAALNREFADVRALAAQYLPDVSTSAETVDLDPSASADFSGEKLPKILIAAEAEASDYIVDRPAGRQIEYLISIGSPGVREPEIFTKSRTDCGWNLTTSTPPLTTPIGFCLNLRTQSKLSTSRSKCRRAGQFARLLPKRHQPFNSHSFDCLCCLVGPRQRTRSVGRGARRPTPG